MRHDLNFSIIHAFRSFIPLNHSTYSFVFVAFTNVSMGPLDSCPVNIIYIIFNIGIMQSFIVEFFQVLIPFQCFLLML